MPVASKNFTDIRFFLKNDVTTAAFVNTTFNGTNAGANVYPNQTFTNTSPVDLVGLSNSYEIKLPTELGVGSVAGDQKELFSDDPIFENVSNGDYILYRNTADEDSGDLKVLGIANIISGDFTSLEMYENSLIYEADATFYSLSKNANSFGFPADANFYMLVKNADYTTGNHDGVLNIVTSAINPSSSVFAYGANRIINTQFFKLQRISKINNASVYDENSLMDPGALENISCTIKGVTKYSEPSLFGSTTITQDLIPYWSVYEINPYGDSGTHFSKNTIYRIDIPSASLPSARVILPTDEIISP